MLYKYVAQATVLFGERRSELRGCKKRCEDYGGMQRYEAKRGEKRLGESLGLLGIWFLITRVIRYMGSNLYLVHFYMGSNFQNMFP